MHTVQISIHRCLALPWERPIWNQDKTTRVAEVRDLKTSKAQLHNSNALSPNKIELHDHSSSILFYNIIIHFNRRSMSVSLDVVWTKSQGASRRLCSHGLSFDFNFPTFFFDCLFVNVHRHYRSWISGHRCLQSGCYFAENIACTWIAVSRVAIASQFDISPFAFCETWLRT